MKFVLFVLMISTLAACTKELTDDRFIGKWDVTTEAFFQSNADQEPTLSAQGTCIYEFSTDGMVSLECDTTKTHYWWYYRNSPRQILLTDMSEPFTHEVTWDIVQCDKNKQVWERVNASGFGINTYRRTLER